jgi:hypothetical protein
MLGNLRNAAIGNRANQKITATYAVLAGLNSVSNHAGYGVRCPAMSRQA